MQLKNTKADNYSILIYLFSYMSLVEKNVYFSLLAPIPLSVEPSGVPVILINTQIINPPGPVLVSTHGKATIFFLPLLWHSVK